MTHKISYSFYSKTFLSHSRLIHTENRLLSLPKVMFGCLCGSHPVRNRPNMARNIHSFIGCMFIPEALIIFPALCFLLQIINLNATSKASGAIVDIHTVTTGLWVQEEPYGKGICSFMFVSPICGLLGFSALSAPKCVGSLFASKKREYVEMANLSHQLCFSRRGSWNE